MHHEVMLPPAHTYQPFYSLAGIVESQLKYYSTRNRLMRYSKSLNIKGAYNLEITWFGTATIGVKKVSDSLIFDPFFPMNSLLPQPDLEQVINYGNIFITHGHFDHTLDIPRLINAGSVNVYCSAEVKSILVNNKVPLERIRIISPGDLIQIGALEVEIFKGAHIRFDFPLVMKTLLSRRALIHFRELKNLFNLAKIYPEGQVLVYKISGGDRTILHLGSLNLDPTESYPLGCSLLTIPFQGRSDLNHYAMQFIEKLQPEQLLLHHFDDAFPPVSSSIDTSAFVDRLSTIYPHLNVIVPRFNQRINI